MTTKFELIFLINKEALIYTYTSTTCANVSASWEMNKFGPYTDILGSMVSH